MKVVFKAEYLISDMQKKISEQSLESKQYINQYLENYSKIEMELLFNNEESLFKPIEKLDSGDEMFYKLALNSVTENKIRYKNNKEKKVKSFFIKILFCYFEFYLLLSLLLLRTFALPNVPPCVGFAGVLWAAFSGVRCSRFLLIVKGL